LSETHIILSKEDIVAIADILKDTFRPELLSVDVKVQAIVDGVLTGLNKKLHHLEQENEELRARVTKLERDADTAEQYSQRNCLRRSSVPENGDQNNLTTGYLSVDIFCYQ
jgi:cell shape-determining protein MreC